MKVTNRMVEPSGCRGCSVDRYLVRLHCTPEERGTQTHRGTYHGLHALSRINPRLACDCLWYHCCLPKLAVCGKQLLSSIYQTVGRPPELTVALLSALVCQVSFLGKPLLPATTKVSSPKAQQRQPGHSPARLHSIKGQRQGLTQK